MLSGEKPVIMNIKLSQTAFRKTDIILPFVQLRKLTSQFYSNASVSVRFSDIRKISYSFLVILFSILFFSCEQKTQQSEKGSLDFEQITPKYAKGFAFEKHKEFQILHILRPFNDKADTMSYLLLPKSTETKPSQFSELQTIRTPIDNFVALSTTHVALADFLNATDKIIGLSSAEYVYNEKIRNRLESKELVSVGDGATLNQEQILTLNPSLLMASGFSQASFERTYRPMLDLGIPVLLNSEWMEETMLGRTEWVKVLGALLGKEELAQSKFAEVEKQYLTLAEIGRNAETKPLVIGGLPYKGMWSIAGSKSYISNLLTDAGANWNWAKDTSSVSLQLDFESVYPIGVEAEYWVRAGSATSKKQLLATDSRFADFKSFQNGNVFNNNQRMSPNGMGNDYWESGIVNPHLILGDLISILHPELRNEELFYYKKLE
jgi:iron complex transport system substrate-binding protein